MNVRKEIALYAAPEHVPALLWLLERYSMSSQWGFVARCEHVRYGPASYQTHRRWAPTREGEILYAAMSGGDVDAN
jgi:hypothetical protein